MNMQDRGIAAFLILVVTVGVLTVVEMIFRPGIAEFAFSYTFAIAGYVVAFLVAPAVIRVLPLRWRSKHGGPH